MESVNSASEALNNSMSSEGSLDKKPLSNGTVENGHHSSSSSKGDGDKHKSSKDHHSSSKDKHHSSSKDKHHSSSSSKHHSSSSSKDKHSSSSSSKDKDRHSSSKHSSSSSKDKDRSDRHKDGHSSSSSKHKDGHHSSSSSSKHKDGSSSSSKHRDDKHKHKHRDGSSSSSKHKDGSSSSSSKHRDDKHKHSSSSSDKHKSSSSSEKREKEKEKSSSSSEMKVKSETVEMKVISETVEVKMEPPETPAKNGVEFSPPKVSPLKVKPQIKEEESDDDMPLTARFDSKPAAVKRPAESDDEDEPLLAKMEKKVKKESPLKRKKMEEDEDYDDDDYAPEKKKKKKDGKKKDKAIKKETPAKSPKAAKGAKGAKGVKAEKGDGDNKSPTKKKGKKEPKEEEEKHKWWEDMGQRTDGTKWTFLEHKGPVFAPDYEPLPDHVRFFYDGKVMKLSPETEEVATFYGRMLDHDYTSQETFNNNFFKDWRKVMTSEEKAKITDLSKCNFKEINVHFKEQSEARKNATKEEKNKIKEQNAKIQEEYGFCTMDNVKEKIGNFRIEPPGLFRGRGTHPKMGMLKKRVMPEDVIINCSKDAVVPKPPAGRKWKEVRHDNTVTWLACWCENIQGATKYVMLNAASRLKGEKDWQKYETARKLHKCVDKIRASYQDDWKSKEMRIRQRAVALYFIDKLALRAGNEKDEDTADTVGCCSLRVEHITLHEKMDNLENVVVFDFLGKDSIRYYNKVSVEKRVFKNLSLFMQNKADEDDIFDRLNTAILNKHLQSLMDGLTAKVFRTYNASRTLQEQLNLLTNPEDPIPAKMLSYNRANRAVAILCNHQRAVPKNFDKQMENLQVKIDAKKDAINVAKKDYKAAKADYKAMKTEKARKMVENKKKAVERLELQLTKLEVQATDKDENKEIALGTSKLNYLDPRISVAWCKKWDVPIEKIYNKTQRDKFAWAIEMADEDYEF